MLKPQFWSWLPKPRCFTAETKHSLGGCKHVFQHVFSDNQSMIKFVDFPAMQTFVLSKIQQKWEMIQTYIGL